MSTVASICYFIVTNLVIYHGGFKVLLAFLNQAHAWFLRIASVCACLYACVCVCVHVCVRVCVGLWLLYGSCSRYC